MFEKEKILSVLVENRYGVLAKISGLFAARAYNIKSLSVGETQDKNVSRMTIVVLGDEKIIEQVKKQLYKVIETIKVTEHDDKNSIDKELCFIKVKSNSKNITDIIKIVETIDGKIIDITEKSLIAQITDKTEKVKKLISVLKPYGILEISRSGIVSIGKEED